MSLTKACLIFSSVWLFASCNSKTNSTASTSATNTLESEKDSFHLAAYVFYIKPSTEKEFTALYNDGLDTSEKAALSKDHEHVKREGGTLLMKCSNGREAKLVNKITDGEDFADFQYMGQMAGHYVVHASFYEWHNYYLINMERGDTTAVRGLPSLSPNGKLLLVGNADLIANFTDNGFEMYNVLPEGLELVGTRELETWGPNRIVWQSDHHMLVERIHIDNSGAETSEKADYIRLDITPQNPNP